MKLAAIQALVLLTVVGCGAQEVDSDPFRELVLNPSGELTLATKLGAARWNKAAGLNVTVDTKGVPVGMVDHVYKMPDGSVAFTDPEGIGEEKGGVNDDTGIWISRAIQIDIDVAVAHEIGHRLGAKHTETGLMFHKGGRLINEESLASVCAVSFCTTFQPESLPPAESLPLDGVIAEGI